MAVTKSYLCTEICKMAGHVRKFPKLNSMSKKELLIVYTALSLLRDTVKLPIQSK